MQTFCFRSTLRTTAWRPPLQTVCFRSTLRPIILRLSPTAAAEWAKPREIRRGTPSSIRRSDGARRACGTILKNSVPFVCTLTVQSARGVYRDLVTRTSGHRKSSTEIAFSDATCVIPRGQQVSRPRQALPADSSDFVVNICVFRPAVQKHTYLQ